MEKILKTMKNGVNICNSWVEPYKFIHEFLHYPFIDELFGCLAILWVWRLKGYKRSWMINYGHDCYSGR